MLCLDVCIESERIALGPISDQPCFGNMLQYQSVVWFRMKLLVRIQQCSNANFMFGCYVDELT